MGRAYEILSDAEKRKYYDRTGRAPDSVNNLPTGDDVNWDEYWRALFRVSSSSSNSNSYGESNWVSTHPLYSHPYYSYYSSSSCYNDE